MTTLRDAAQQALEALEDHAKQYPHMQKGYTVDAITALRAALAEPAERKPLTTEEIYECERIAAIRHHRHKNSIRGQQLTPADDPQWHFARAIERAHGIGEHE